MSIRTNLLMASIPALSVVLALSLGETRLSNNLSGFVYFLYMAVGLPGKEKSSSKTKELNAYAILSRC